MTTTDEELMEGLAHDIRADPGHCYMAMDMLVGSKFSGPGVEMIADMLKDIQETKVSLTSTEHTHMAALITGHHMPRIVKLVRLSMDQEKIATLRAMAEAKLESVTDANPNFGIF